MYGSHVAILQSGHISPRRRDEFSISLALDTGKRNGLYSYRNLIFLLLILSYGRF